MLVQDSSRDPDEQEFIMAMLKSWEEGKAEARLEDRVDGPCSPFCAFGASPFQTPRASASWPRRTWSS
jgi:hypothetical protein